ncbi:hypothetical protein [Streptomyces maremycinicus]|uniref:hypothetical protein n=1 Tax=Streptomyces maremycinicus TaxID=1679753 RepID=UPI0007886A37|nr:hypothetical protein [Streptomyces sp. NBRC 110468]
MQEYDLTDAQKKAFADNEADFRRLDAQVRGTQETARARLIAHGWGSDSEETIPCLSCPCPDFQPGGALHKCKRGSCRHPLSDHDLPE